jgi:hypothetical protein
MFAELVMEAVKMGTGLLPKGFKCECGKQHHFPSYVYAHWKEELFFTCTSCSRTYYVLEGIATGTDTKCE